MVGAFCSDHKSEGMVDVKSKRCCTSGCTKRPSFNHPGEIGGVFCSEHKSEGMVDVKSKRCRTPGCTKGPVFNRPGEIVGAFCSEHKSEEMVNVKTKRCRTPGCTKVPSFNLPGEIGGAFCFEHKSEKMVDVKSKRCQHPGCTKIPSFNHPGEIVGVFCSEHKSEEMVNVKTKRCRTPGCTKVPSFNLPGEIVGMFCFEHKSSRMVNVKHKRCQHPECTKQPVFNHPGEIAGAFCSDHKSSGMVNVKSKRCRTPGCMKQPVFNHPGEIVRAFCSEHKSDGMVDVKSKRCRTPGCTKRPNFNHPGETAKLFCSEHKLSGMVDTSKHRCSYLENKRPCKNIPHYGFPDKRAHRCETHMLPGMVHLAQVNQCSVPDCGKEHTFIVPSTGRKYCVSHAPEEFENAMKRLCKYCDIRESSEHVCSDCRSRSHKKEWSVVSHLRRTIDTRFTYDSSSMLQGCSKKRPDIFFDLPSHCLIVEVDENQHRTYSDNCECARINEIVNGIGGRSVILIRYNPDSVRDNQGKMLHITPAERIDLLVSTVKQELTRTYDTFLVKIIQVWYDDPPHSGLTRKEYEPVKEDTITDMVCI